MGRNKLHGADTRNALLEAGERLIQDGGNRAVSVRSVADACGTTTRAVYSLFGSKRGLLDALACRFFESLNEAIDATPFVGDPLADVANGAVGGFRQTALEHRALYSLVFLDVIPDVQLGESVEAVSGQSFARLRARLGALDDEAGIVAHSVNALTEGLAAMELRGNAEHLTDEEAEAIWRSSITALLTGFGPSAHRQHRDVSGGRYGSQYE
jgi:AcrR family transcriptional regulator